MSDTINNLSEVIVTEVDPAGIALLVHPSPMYVRGVPFETVVVSAPVTVSSNVPGIGVGVDVAVAVAVAVGVGVCPVAVSGRNNPSNRLAETARARVAGVTR